MLIELKKDNKVFSAVDPMTVKERDENPPIKFEEIKERQSAACKKASEIWKMAYEAKPDNPYLIKKRIKAFGIREHYNRLIVPIYSDFGDHEDNPVSVQYIDVEGKKSFHPGSPVTGGFHFIGNLTDTDLIYVVEGFATGVTVYEAVQTPVVISFSSGNIKSVCARLKARLPNIRLVIAADNDIETEKKTGHNSGKKAAMEAAEELGIEFVLCPVNSDFNDLFNQYAKEADGYRAVQESLNEKGSGDIYDQIIEQLNSQYAITWLGGKCLVLKENKRPESENIELEFTSDTDLRRYYANKMIPDPNDSKREINIVEYWLKSSDRRQYKGVVFEPGKKLPAYYNLWTNFSVKPIKGDWSLFRDHILNIITNSNENQYKWVMSWMARIVQDPGGERPGTSIVLRGGRGTGKGKFVNCFGHLFGQHYIQLAQQSHLLGRFNHHLKNKVLVFADEGFWAGDKQSEGAIKNMITEPRLVIEQKGKDAITVRNCMNIIIASNNDWVVPAGIDERRFYVTDVSDAHKQDHPYFEAITKQMEDGGYEAMLYDLLEWSYTMKELRQAPKTDALLDQIRNTMDVAGKFWMERLEDGTLSSGQEGWTGEIECQALYGEYLQFSSNLKERFPLTPQLLGREIGRFCKGIDKVKTNRNGSRINVYRFPSLEECRRQYETLVRMEGLIDWENGPR